MAEVRRRSRTMTPNRGGLLWLGALALVLSSCALLVALNMPWAMSQSEAIRTAQEIVARDVCLDHPLEEFRTNVKRSDVYTGWRVAFSDSKGNHITIDFPDDPKSYQIV